MLEQLKKNDSQHYLPLHGENSLQKKCDNEAIKIMDTHSENELSVFDSRLYYQCSSCNEKWIMSIPDNAWRGYFLINSNALKYHDELMKDERKRSIGCWAIIAIVLALILWSIIN